MNRATLPPGANIGGQYSILIIDSGVDTTHSLLKTASIETFAFQSDGPPLLESGVDEFGHGTAIAGLIHAISPDTIIHSLRVFGRSLTAQSQTVLAALSWGIAQGYPIINCSFGTTERQLLPAFKSLVDAAYRRNTWIVAATNGADDFWEEYPAYFPSVFATNAGEYSDLELIRRQTASLVEFRAAGNRLKVLWKDGGERVVSGSSYSAAVLSGHLARLRRSHPDWNVCDTKSHLYRHCSIEPNPEK